MAHVSALRETSVSIRSGHRHPLPEGKFWCQANFCGSHHHYRYRSHANAGNLEATFESCGRIFNGLVYREDPRLLIFSL